MTIRVTTLDNGLRVVSDPVDTVESVSLGAWVEVGTRHEAAEINGVSHMLEHMAFKGTERRNALQLAEEIEDVGGHINAYTSRENTAYYAKVLKDDVGLAVDMIGDILQHSTFDPTELERERSVILQEIHQANDTPDDIVFDHFQEVAYPDQAMGRPVLGTVDSVNGLSRESIMGYMRDNYAASNMVFSASGNIDHDHLVDMVSKHFTNLPKNTNLKAEPTVYQGGHLAIDRPSLEQAHVVAGFDAVAYDDPRFYALSILSMVLGGGMSSRLFQEIREKRGMVYSIYSFVSALDDGGMLGFYAGCGAKDVPDLLPVLSEEFVKVSRDISPQELTRARAQLKASILMSLESTSTRCEQLARQMIVFNRPIDPSEIVEKIEAVTLEDLYATAQQVFATAPTLTALGPVGDMGTQAYFTDWQR